MPDYQTDSPCSYTSLFKWLCNFNTSTKRMLDENLEPRCHLTTLLPRPPNSTPQTGFGNDKRCRPEQVAAAGLRLHASKPASVQSPWATNLLASRVKT